MELIAQAPHMMNVKRKIDKSFNWMLALWMEPNKWETLWFSYFVEIILEEK